jgi:hypothetical protein
MAADAAQKKVARCETSGLVIRKIKRIEDALRYQR